MANTLKIKRGLETNRSGQTPASGELLVTTDEDKLYVGDGSTAGGIPVNPEFDAFNGMAYDKPTMTVVNDTGLQLDVENILGGDMEFIIDGIKSTLDCTTGSGVGGKARVALTAGADVNTIAVNYIYITNSGTTATLNASTSLPTGSFCWIGKVVVNDATSWVSYGAMGIQRYTEALTNDSRGLLSHAREKLRALGAVYISGVTQTLNITTNGGAPDNVHLATGSGQIYQLHRQTYPAFSTGPYYYGNGPDIYEQITDLNAILTDSESVSLSGKRFNLVVWGAVNLTTGDCKMYVNIPNAGYSKDSEAQIDNNATADYTVPLELRSVAFMICRIALKHSVAASGTWTELGLYSLLGQPTGVRGGGAGAVASTEFVDSTFRVYDNADATKEIALEASGITTGTTRTITMPDRDIDLGDVYDWKAGTEAGFNSLGIDDNATTDTRLSIGDDTLYVGTSGVGEDYSICKPSGHTTLTLSGSGGADTGANIRLYGEGATRPNNILLRTGVNTELEFDASAGTWDFQGNNIETIGQTTLNDCMIIGDVVMDSTQPKLTLGGPTLSTGVASIEVGTGRTGDGLSSISLVGDTTYASGGLIIDRLGGANADSTLTHRGTGTFSLMAQDAGAVTLGTNNNVAVVVDVNQDVELLGDLTVADSTTVGGVIPRIKIGDASTTSSAALRIGTDRTGDASAYIDLITDTITYTDYGSRIIRGSGANGQLQIVNRGTGDLDLKTVGLADVRLRPNATTVLTAEASTGNVVIAAASDLTVDNIVETTAASGVTIDGLLIKDGEIASTGIPDNSISLAKMAHGTDGNLITYDAAGAPAYVSTGTADQVLTSNGAGAAPTFQDAAGGGGDRVELASIVASSSSTIDFEGYYSSTYTDYVVTFSSVILSSSADVEARVYASGAWQTGSSDYSWVNHHQRFSYNSDTVSDSTDEFDNAIRIISGASYSSARINGELTMIHPRSTSSSINKLIYYVGYHARDTSARNLSHEVSIGKYTESLTVQNTGIRIFPTAGTFTSGRFVLYGIKKT